MTTVTKKQQSTLKITPPAQLPLAVALSSDTNNENIDNETDNFLPLSEDGVRVSEDVYWAKYYEHPYFNYEWNNGILEEKPVSNYITDESYAWLYLLLREYLKYNPIAKLAFLETGGRFELTDETTIRKPDLGVVLHSNLVPYEDKDSSYKGTFDMTIEAISKLTKRDKERDTITKKREYGEAGVKEFWIIDGEKTETVFYRLNEQGVYEDIEEKDGIIRSKVLLGFQFRKKDLYERPTIEVLRHDEVYKHFVALNLQAETKARQQAEYKAKIEAKARQQAVHKAKIEAEARHAAEMEIKRLKALLEKRTD